MATTARQTRRSGFGRSRSAGTKKRKRPEQVAGAKLIRWIDSVVLEDGTRPGLYFAHTPNGGARSKIEAAIFKGQGVRKGWPDYTLYLPRNGYHGFVQELKAENGAKPDKEQLEILARLEEAGFAVAVSWGYRAARNDLEQYLGLPLSRALA
ncbi:MAG TPA: VRR-NUC domain-containing protein [Woeseiaceae bacterium]|nr:VRR-NUC domain-containing protein [Woeseiaceae bacterium]